MIRTLHGTDLARGFTRVVRGTRGTYVEIAQDELLHSSLSIPDSAKWRLDSEREGDIYYYEYRVRDVGYAKLYLQVKRVAYADYIPGMWYVALEDLQPLK